MLFWRQEKQIQKGVEEYLQQTEHCLESFRQAMEVYFAEGLSDRFEQLAEKTHNYEHAADDQRRQIEESMYGRALIPESRGDILGMLEALDLVPNKCESVLYQIWTQKTVVPGAFAEQTRQLVQVNVDSFGALCQTVRDLFGQVKRVAVGAKRVTEKENQSDQIERQLIRAIFDSDSKDFQKILLKELVLEIGAISDRAENAADRLRIVSIKRRS